MKLKSPLFVSLDIDDIQKVKKIVIEVGPLVGGFKIGPRLVLQQGPQIISEIAEVAPVFYDPKYFDIPSTMLASIRSSFDVGASFVTIHALSGKKAMKEIAKLEAELNQQRPFKILAVTVLTSWDESDTPKNFIQQPISEHVKTLGQAVIESGLTGLVCSPHELTLFKSQGLFVVTPGIRLDGHNANDQVRIQTPRQAIENGSSALVIGRSIIEAKSSVEAVEDILHSISLI